LFKSFYRAGFQPLWPLILGTWGFTHAGLERGMALWSGLWNGAVGVFLGGDVGWLMVYSDQ
jgi:hypothetical protein